MAVAQVRVLDDVGLYVPYHTGGRGRYSGLVGMLGMDANATGLAGGGSVTISITASKDAFGFPFTWVPTFIGVDDNLAAAEEVRVSYNGDGNRLLAFSPAQNALSVRSGSQNTGVFSNLAIPIEPDGEDPVGILTAVWPTNTDTKLYHLHVFGPVYDMQVIARNYEITEMLAGLR